MKHGPLGGGGGNPIMDNSMWKITFSNVISWSSDLIKSGHFYLYNTDAKETIMQMYSNRRQIQIML